MDPLGRLVPSDPPAVDNLALLGGIAHDGVGISADADIHYEKELAPYDARYAATVATAATAGNVITRTE
jgi:hypothetical protein